MSDFFGWVLVYAFWLIVMSICFIPYVTHLIWCIDKASETGSAIALLIAGLVIPPIGWLHGVSLWLGFTWI